MTGGRYDALPIGTVYVSDDGGGIREVRYWRRRPLPVPEAMATLATHAVTTADRLDLIASEYLGDPLAFWRIADANPALDPDTLVAPEGRGPAPRDSHAGGLNMPAPGLRLTVLTGEHPLTPLPAADTARLRSVTVKENDEQHSVFTLTFDARRSARDGAFDAPGLATSPLDLFTRVVMEVCFGGQAGRPDGRRHHPGPPAAGAGAGDSDAECQW